MSVMYMHLYYDIYWENKVKSLRYFQSDAWKKIKQLLLFSHPRENQKSKKRTRFLFSIKQVAAPDTDADGRSAVCAQRVLTCDIFCHMWQL